MSSDNYSRFADLYSTGSYPRYSNYIAGKLPDIMGQIGIQPESILDLACGEGTFATEAAQLGFEVTGIDVSSEMIEIARENADDAGVEVTFIEQDMRSLVLDETFDLVTSWFDSMNYITDRSDFKKTLENVQSLLGQDGFFVFDMNTIHGLSVQWQEHDCYVQRDDSSVFEVHRTSYEAEKRIAKLKITFFVKSGNRWEKHEEVHEERGYELEEVEKMAAESGFVVSDIWGEIEGFSSPQDDSGRVWYVLRNNGS